MIQGTAMRGWAYTHNREIIIEVPWWEPGKFKTKLRNFVRPFSRRYHVAYYYPGGIYSYKREMPRREFQ